MQMNFVRIVNKMRTASRFLFKGSEVKEQGMDSFTGSERMLDKGSDRVARGLG